MIVYILYMHYKGNDSYDDNYTEILGCYKNYEEAKEEMEKLELEYKDEEYQYGSYKYFRVEEKYLIE